jgi:phosphohistidine phosphatase
VSRSAEDDEDATKPACSLYLVRHAIAAERGDKWPDDTKRPLTQKGRARMRQAVAGLQAFGVKIDVVLTSPLVRARQTAEILVEGLESSPDLEEIEALAPDHRPTEVAHALGTYTRCGALALVGHEPGVGELAAWLIGAREPLPFRKGGVCRIDTPALPPGKNCQLIWCATPRMLRALAT